MEKFDAFKRRVAQQQRICGMYVVEGQAVPETMNAGAQLEEFFLGFAARCGFCEPDNGNAEWKHAEVFREEARDRLVSVLLGGGEIGHSRWDVPPEEAAAIADEFLDLFGGDARFFCDRAPERDAQPLGPSGHPRYSDYIFSGGCVAFDSRLAALVWVFDND